MKSKYNEKEALSVKGVKAVVPIPSQQVTLKNYPESIAVVAESNWQAVKGMEILNPVFKDRKMILSQLFAQCP